MNMFKKVLSSVLCVALVLPSVGKIHASPEHDVDVVEPEKIYTMEKQDSKDYKEMYLKKKSENSKLKQFIDEIKEKNKESINCSIRDFIETGVSVFFWVWGYRIESLAWGMFATIYKLIALNKISATDTFINEVEQMANE